MAFVFEFQTLSLINFTKIYQLKGLEPKNKVQTNFYERCDLTKKCGMGYHTTKMGSLATVYYLYIMIYVASFS